MDLPNKKYSVIYADPPWNYSQKGAAGKKQLLICWGMFRALNFLPGNVCPAGTHGEMKLKWRMNLESTYHDKMQTVSVLRSKSR